MSFVKKSVKPYCKFILKDFSTYTCISRIYSISLNYQLNINHKMTFIYKIIKETEKAAYLSVPYWKATGESKSKHKQLYYETWVPKAVIDKGLEALKSFVISTKANKRQSNSWTAGRKLPNYWNSLGQMAPAKVQKTRRVLDEDKYMEMVKSFREKYNASDIRPLWHNPDNYKVEESDYETIEQMMVRNRSNTTYSRIPYKQVTYWQ